MKTITGGLYLVVDPYDGLHTLSPKIEAALEGGVEIIQLWDHWNGQDSILDFIKTVCNLAKSYNVPVLVNNTWQWLARLPIDGIHFDTIPHDLPMIKKHIGRPFTCGITCGNDLAVVEWAIDHNLDYISFCSVFPSSTRNSCDLVDPEIMKRARAMTTMPIFAAGGVTRARIPQLLALGVNGVAVVSDIMKASDPAASSRLFNEALQRQHNNI